MLSYARAGCSLALSHRFEKVDEVEGTRSQTAIWPGFVGERLESDTSEVFSEAEFKTVVVCYNAEERSMVHQAELRASFVLTRFSALRASRHKKRDPAVRPRKNWLFIGHPEAGDRAAVFYSLMASCRLHGINPFEYLKDVFTRLPAAKINEVEAFTPSEWAKRRRA
ncbi:MAG: transposase domain-containing protein [Verrucomicrobiales bacterium]|nr:transposase domain-containing protein [Verrucomicrobiales bacterium]